MMIYKISFFKILVELVAINIFIAFICSVKAISNHGTYVLTLFINFVVCLFILFRIDVFKISFHDMSITIHKFKLGSRPQELKINYELLTAKYIYHNIGHNVKQLQLEIFKGNEIQALIVPSFSGWQHSTIDQIVKNLSQKNVMVQTEEA